MIVEKIAEKFEKLSRTAGKKHTFLYMDIEFIGGKKFALTTLHQINEALKYFEETLKGNIVNPKKSQLFTINNETKYIDDEKKECHHSITANILWIMKLLRPYFETAVYFLLTIIQ